MTVGKNLLDEEVRGKTPNPLMRRELLSQVASLYDPIGLVTPATTKGRRSCQKGVSRSWRQNCDLRHVGQTSV